MAVLVNAPPGRTEPPPEADGPNIAYVHSPASSCSPDCDTEIHLAHPDGSESTPLTENDFNEGDPQWSPDGTKLAFVGSNAEDRDIWVVNADGSGEINLTQDPFLDQLGPRWSPDGTRLAFVSRDADDGGQTDLWTIAADGSDARLVTEYARDPQWSPDGGLISFVGQEAEFPLVVAKPDGGAPKRIAGRVPADHHDWSPAGRRIAFARAFSSRIWSAAPDGTLRRFVASASDDDSIVQVFWFPSGRVVGAETYDFASSSAWFYRWRLDGTTYCGGSICGGAHDPRAITLSPSGTYFAYTDCGPGGDCNEIYVRPTLGPEPTDSIAQADFSELDWQPVCTFEGTDESETIEGTSGNDLICGLGGDDEIIASGGDDIVLGGEGDDTLRGGEGDDLLTDLSGADVLLGGPGKDSVGSRDQSSGDRIGAGAGGDLCRADPADLKEGC